MNGNLCQGLITATTYAVDFPHILEQTYEFTLHTTRVISHLLRRIRNNSYESFSRVTRNIRIPRIGSLSLTGSSDLLVSGDRTNNNFSCLQHNNYNNRRHDVNNVRRNNGNDEIQTHYVNVFLHRIRSTLSSVSLSAQSNFHNSKVVILHAMKYGSEKLRKTILFLLRFFLRLP